MDRKISLKYSFFSIHDKMETHHFFLADRPGVVKDIRLDKLEQFANMVEREANKNGFSFYKGRRRPSAAVLSGAATSSASAELEIYIQVEQLVVKKYADRVELTDRDEPKTMSLLAIDKRSVTDTRVLPTLLRLARESFIIGDSDNFTEEMNLDLPASRISSSEQS